MGLSDPGLKPYLTAKLDKTPTRRLAWLLVLLGEGDVRAVMGGVSSHSGQKNQLMIQEYGGTQKRV